MPWLSPLNAASALVFCPVCKAEYREGFTRCTECSVALITALPADQPAAGMSDLALAWRGTDPTAFSAALAALQGAAIPSYQVSDHDQFVWGLAIPRPQYRILVRKTDLEAARDLVAPFGERAALALARDIWKGRNEFQEFEQENLHKASAEIPSSDEQAPDDIPTELDPKNATSEVWAGEDAMAHTLNDCLRENGIDCVLTARGEATQVLVGPNFEARAREIIREVIEATPPG
jgi:hypothetical protein